MTKMELTQFAMKLFISYCLFQMMNKEFVGELFTRKKLVSMDSPLLPSTHQYHFPGERWTAATQLCISIRLLLSMG